MPIYEYDCQQCGTFEVSQKMNDPHLSTHEVCGGPVERRISRSTFALKGAGWYADGYASSSGGGGGSAAPACGTGGCGTGSCGS